jgi:hypothetical protein
MTQSVFRRGTRPPGPTDPSGHALELVRSALDVAELLVEHVILPEVATPETRDFTKEVGEVSMLLRLADRVLPEQADRARIARLGGQIAPIARSGATANMVVVRPSRAAAHLLAHGCLQQVGCTDAAFDELARTALGSSAAGAAERVPYRLLDVAWIRHLVLGDAELDHPALPVSPIAQGVDLVATTIDDAYAFSHALPYATDFGRRPLPGWADGPWLSGIADALILKSLDEDDLDLLGELLMAPALLRTPWTSVQWFGWQVLCDTWRRYGFVPGPGLPEAIEGESHTDAVRRVLGTVYHTTLVGGLAVATLCSTGHLPPDEPPDAPVGPSAWVDPDGPPRAWRRVWHRLDRAEREALNAVPAGMALHRAVSDTNVVAILRALDSNAVEGMPEPLVMQAAELVNRLAVLVGAQAGVR